PGLGRSYYRTLGLPHWTRESQATSIYWRLPERQAGSRVGAGNGSCSGRQTRPTIREYVGTSGPDAGQPVGNDEAANQSDFDGPGAAIIANIGNTIRWHRSPHRRG